MRKAGASKRRVRACSEKSWFAIVPSDNSLLKRAAALNTNVHISLKCKMKHSCLVLLQIFKNCEA